MNICCKSKSNIYFWFAGLFVAFILPLLSFQQTDPWTEKDLLAPEKLAAILNDSKSPQPVIYNMGPSGNIAGSIEIGEGRDEANIKKLVSVATKVDKNKLVVIYCGCCPLIKCPNTRPAFAALKKEGFKNLKLLNLSQNLKVNWIDKGFPVIKN